MSLTEQIVDREPLGQSQGNSGNPIERVTLADGRNLVLKRVSPEWDWMARATNDTGRVVTMWDERVFARMPASIDPAVEAVERDNGSWSIFMRDISRTLVSEEVRHDRATVRRVLAASAALHTAFWDVDLPQLCTIEERYGMLSLRTAERERGTPVGDLIVRAWSAFNEHAPRDIADTIATLAVTPSLIADQLRTCSQTLIHGDLRIGNTGFDGGRTVFIDWGERTGVAPPPVELAWFIGFDSQRLGVTRDAMVEDFRALYDDRVDDRALDLGLIGGLLHVAPQLGLRFISASDDAGKLAEAREELAWWTGVVTGALERTWSPGAAAAG